MPWGPQKQPDIRQNKYKGLKKTEQTFSIISPIANAIAYIQQYIALPTLPEGVLLGPVALEAMPAEWPGGLTLG